MALYLNSMNKVVKNNAVSGSVQNRANSSTAQNTQTIAQHSNSNRAILLLVSHMARPFGLDQEGHDLGCPGCSVLAGDESVCPQIFTTPPF